MLNLRKADSNSIKKCIVRSYLPHVNGQIYKKKKGHNFVPYRK